MNSKPEWARYLEVWPLDGKLGDGSAAAEPTPSRATTSAGSSSPRGPSTSPPACPTTDLERKKSDLFVRAGDRRERARRGQEALRAVAVDPRHRAGRRSRAARAPIEDLVTAAHHSAGQSEPIVPREVGPAGARRSPRSCARRSSTSPTRTPTAGGAASVSEGGVFFQRYNGNGVDLNRDWPDIGFSFRPYSGLSEPESRALAAFFDDVKSHDRRRVRRRRRPARPADRRRALLHAAAARPPRLRQGPAHPRHGDRDPPELREGAPVVADHPAERRAAGRRPPCVPGAAGRRLRPDLRPDLGHRLRHDQLHDHRRARRLLRLVDRARARTASTTRCRSRTSTRTSSSTRTPSSCTWTATRR